MKLQLRHDPRTKQNIKDMLYSYMYDPVQHKFKERLSRIILKNSTALGSSHACFIYKNELYQLDENERPPRKVNRLLPELHSEMNEYLKDINRLNMHEIPYVMGFINQVLNSSEDLQDYMRVLPKVLHRPLQDAIESCPCCTSKLTPETVEEMCRRNYRSIELMKARLVRNLILN